MNQLIKKYTKKPVEIQAVLYDGSNESIAAIKSLSTRRDVVDTEKGLVIKTLEGNMLASLGDYIIKGIKDELYPCKPDIFKATYEYTDNNK